MADKWLYDSLEAGELQPEAEYETGAFDGARLARERRQAGERASPLRGLAVAIVEKDETAAERLKLLAKLAGATVTASSRANVVVDAATHALLCKGGGTSARRRGDGAVVGTDWLYDSVSACARMEADAYVAPEVVALW